jgi:hypothetical protein
LILNNSHIRAQALRGAGGNIALDTTLLASPASTVEASGTLTIGQLVLPESLINVLPSPTFTQALELSRNRCVTRLREGQVSRFVIGGRDGVPLEPGSLLLSPLARMDQEGMVERNEHERQHPAAQLGWSASVQAQALGVGEIECARRVGNSRTAGTPQWSRSNATKVQ